MADIEAGVLTLPIALGGLARQRGTRQVRRKVGSVRIEELTDAELALRPHRVRGPVASALLDRGAVLPERAVVYAPDSPEAHRDLVRLYESHVVKSTTDGRCWFDLRTFYVVKARRERMRAMIAVPVAIILAIFTVSLYPG